METVYARNWPRGVDRDQIVVLRDVSWEQYEAILAIRGERPKPRLAYLDGVLELMTTSTDHEVTKTIVGRLVEAFADATGHYLDGAGSSTFCKEAKRGGLEPDECYYLRPTPLTDLAPEEVLPPDIAIEIVHTRGDIDKLEIYRRLGVQEVWFWIDGRFWVYALSSESYDELDRSRLLPNCDLDEIARLVVTTKRDGQTSTVRAYREAVTARLSGGTRPNS